MIQAFSLRYVVRTLYQIYPRPLTSISTGACILYGISRVVIGENKTFLGGEAYLKQRGIEVEVLESKECQDLMDLFIKEKPEVWYVDAPRHS
jgi:cytosine deaminase